MGIEALPADRFRKPHPDRDEAFYFEDWMDTSETKALLNYHFRTLEDYKKELKRDLASSRRVTFLLRPLIRRALLRDSPYYKSNREGLLHPHNAKTMSELLNSFPDDGSS